MNEHLCVIAFLFFSFLDRTSEVRKEDYSPSNQVSDISWIMNIITFDLLFC